MFIYTTDYEKSSPNRKNVFTCLTMSTTCRRYNHITVNKTKIEPRETYVDRLPDESANDRNDRGFAFPFLPFLFFSPPLLLFSSSPLLLSSSSPLPLLIPTFFFFPPLSSLFPLLCPLNDHGSHSSSSELVCQTYGRESWCHFVYK